MASVEEYLALVTSFHRGKPKFAATITTLTQPVADLRDVIGDLPIDFDIDQAVGVQLDAVGEWVGRTRYIPIPIANVWFSFDDATRGFDQGVWRGPYDGTSGITRLDDDTYRLFLFAKVAANGWDGTVESAKAAYDLIFSRMPESLLFVADRGDMSMTVGIAQRIPNILFLSLLEQGFLPLKPEGVKLVFEITSVDDTPVFGFDITSDYIAGFDVGSWGVAPEYFTA